MNKNKSFPLIAILRGIEPNNVVRIAKLLVDEGFSMIEVPLNSPDAMKSIELLVNEFLSESDNSIYVGAGTVTNIEQAKAVVNTGANLVVSPNTDIEVIKAALAANCLMVPGVVTPTEAYTAINAGAKLLKVFPIDMLGIKGFKALKMVLPDDVKCFPVGGISAEDNSMIHYLSEGADGFGLGSALFKAQMSDIQIQANAKAFIEKYQVIKQIL